MQPETLDNKKKRIQRDSRDSRGPPNEKAPFAMTPVSGPETESTKSQKFN